MWLGSWLSIIWTFFLHELLRYFLNCSVFVLLPFATYIHLLHIPAYVLLCVLHVTFIEHAGEPLSGGKRFKNITTPDAKNRPSSTTGTPSKGFSDHNSTSVVVINGILKQH